MFRSLAALLLAAALAFTPAFARPAHALDEKELLGLLAGIAALAIIKKEYDERKAERRAPPVRHETPRRHDRWHSESRVLPGQCQFRLEGRNGQLRNVLGPRCLQRNGVKLSRLPDSCLREVYTTRGWREAYAVRCMRRAGWEISGTRRIGD